ncbi:MAG: hypothetical protein JEZ12_16985 [Desulfobacterium sp.]|nr:hypothetical protein [Desulfobacterium sp.]
MKTFGQTLVLVWLSMAASVLVNFSAPASCLGSQSLGVTRIVPQGTDVPEKRQITIEFNQKVVPLGRMERDSSEIPVTVTPPLDGQWRWLTPSTLSLELDGANRLKPATRYTMTIRPGLVAENGATMERSLVHSFITKTPKVRYTSFQTWKSPGTPVIQVVFNQPVIKASVAKHIIMALEMTSGKRVALGVTRHPNDLKPPIMVDGPGGKDEARARWLVSPEKALPHDTPVTLRVSPGLISALGPVPGTSSRLLVRFDTFPEFKFLGLRCYLNNENDPTLIRAGVEQDLEWLKPNPLSYTALVFSSPVTVDQVRKTLEFYPNLGGDRTGYNPWANLYSYSSMNVAHTRGRTYQVSLPELLKAYNPYRIKESELRLKDEFGRRLETPLDFSFHTDHRVPDYTLYHDTSVLEAGVDTDVPLVVTNLDRLRVNYKRLTVDGRTDHLEAETQVPKAEDVAFKMPLGIKKMLANGSGAVYGTISTRPDIKKSDQEKTFFAQVTPFQIHVKSGHFNTLVWVADLKTGHPVANADVLLYTDSMDGLNSDRPVLARAVTGGDGTALLPGNANLDPKLDLFSWRGGDKAQRFFVKVVKKDAMALLPLAPRFRIDTYRASGSSFSSYHNRRYSHIHTWGTTAQGVYRAGDTIQYKIYVRDQNNETFVEPPGKAYTLKVTDPLGKVVLEKSGIELSAFGAFDGEFKVAETGNVGWYSFELTSDFTDMSWSPLRVLVSDFVPSPFRVATEFNNRTFRPGSTVEVTTSARLHAGGPYTDAATRIVTRLEPRRFSSSHPLVKDFNFQSEEEEDQGRTIFETQANLDERGDLVNAFDLIDHAIPFGRLVVEAAVQDDRGKSIASTASAEFFGRNQFVGLRSDHWLYHQGEKAVFPFVVVDEKGTPVAGIETRFSVEQLKTKAARVKGAGNAYLTHYVDEWVAVHKATALSGEAPGTMAFVPEAPGSYRLSARIKDSQGLAHTSSIRFWTAGKGRVLWHEPEANVLTLIPEKESLKVGDTARYLVKNPFPGAKALVTIERYGVLKHWVTTLEGSTPVIAFPIEPDFAPGFFFSISLLSPRVAKPLGEGGIDLGKPLVRMGYHRVEVTDPAREIKVEVAPEKESYKPGERVRVALRADLGKARKNEPVELAVAVLDEAVFDLIRQGRDHFDPLKGFNSVDGLDLVNYSLLEKLVGIQNFAKKGASPGGDGGAAISMRSVFKFVSYWNPSIQTDEKGRTTIEFTVPDNLTGWRVFAMAVTPTDRMGLGDQGFKVNRPTEVRPVMPNQVMVGDNFRAGFSVMNRTDTERVITVKVGAEGSLDGKPSMVTEKLTLSPFKRKTVFLPVTTKKEGEVRFQVTARDHMDGDGMVHRVIVKPRKDLQTVAAYSSTVESRVSQTLKIPGEIRTDKGSLGVVLSSSALGNIESAVLYMRDYPYTCWEQKLSRAIVAAGLPVLRPYLDPEVSWEDSDGVVKTTLDQAVNFQAPNGGMAYFRGEDRYVSPYLSAYTALGLHWIKAAGHDVPEPVETKLHAYLEEFLKQDLVPGFYSKGMVATVRAVALAALSANNRVNRGDLERLLPHVASMSLFGKAMFLQAALATPEGDAMAREVAASILARSNRTGGKISFTEELDSGYSRLAATPMRANAAILSALIRFGRIDTSLSKEIPTGLVRYITQTRGGRDYWENTQETVFSINALIEYARVYESRKTAMTVTASVDGKALGTAGFQGKNQESVTLSRKIQPADPGKTFPLVVEKQGDGRLYYKATLSYIPKNPPNRRINAGMDIRKEVRVQRNGQSLLLANPMTLKRGDLVRVDLFISLAGPRNFVVVEDPVPGGLEPVNRELATTSVTDADRAEPTAADTTNTWHEFSAGRWSFYHKELKHDAARFYSDWLAPGNYRLSYMAQAICEGTFAWLPVRAQEMYDMDVFGQGLETTLVVTDGQ